MTRLCEGCPEPATASDDSGLPLCASWLAELSAEPLPPSFGHNRGYEGGYEAGFADGVNDAAPGLLNAARRVLFFPSDDAIFALRQAVATAAGSAE